MNALVVSLNFNPGHFSHLVANYRLLEECGYVPYLYVNPGFAAMDPENTFRKVTSPAGLRPLGTLAAAVFWFPSLRNVVEMFRLRLFKGARIVYVFHEPFDSIANYHRSGFSALKIARIVAINLVNIPVLWMAHEVVLPSAVSDRLYRRKYLPLNRHAQCIPLLFDDEAATSEEQSDADKGCIAYIGTVAPDHAFDAYVDFVRACVERNLLPGLRFDIATRSEIPSREAAILAALAESGRVHVQAGRPLGTDEINRHYRDALVVWNAYRRSNQSGVLPKAFMFGAAVLSSAGNDNEFVEDRLTGRIIHNRHDVQELAAAVEDIRDHAAAYGRECRARFLTTFYYRSKMKDFSRLLGGNELHAAGA